MTDRWKTRFASLTMLNFLTIILPYLCVLGVYIASWIKPGAGYEYYLLIFTPLIVVVFFLGLIVVAANSILIPIYLLRHRTRRRFTVLGWLAAVVSMTYLGVVFFIVIDKHISHQASIKRFSQKEAVVLIQNCEISELIKQRNDNAQLIGKANSSKREFKKNPYHGTSAKFSVLEQAVKKAEQKCGAVRITDNNY